VIANSPVTIAAGQLASFNGIIYATNGYNSTVNVGCSTGSTQAPQNCPMVQVPLTISPASFSVLATDVSGDYNFNVHAVGTDTAATIHDFAAVLHITDFILGPPSLASVNVVPGASSVPIFFQVSVVSTFSSSVALSCSGLPRGRVVNFSHRLV
jgi:hypothetical protein